MVDRWKRIVPPVAGVVLVALTAVGVSLGSTPDSGSSGAKVLAWYTVHHDKANAMVALFGYASLVAVVFFAGVASYLRRRGSDLCATLTVAGGVLMAVGFGLGAGSTAALADSTSKITADAAQALNQISEDIFFITLFGGLALATLAMGIAMLRTAAMPKALGIITVIVGVGAVSGIGSWFAFMASGLLFLAVAWFLYQRTGQQDAITMPDMPSPRSADTTAGAKADA